MSLVSEVQTELGLLKQKAQELEAKLAPAIPRIEALEGNPVVDALLSALHVPPSGLALVTQLLAGLEEIYKPEDAATPAPVTAPQPVAPSAGVTG
jgi:hypothetical protein